VCVYIKGELISFKLYKILAREINQVACALVARSSFQGRTRGNTGFDSQEEQRLASAHASTHEPDFTIGASKTNAKEKKSYRETRGSKLINACD